MAFRPYTGADRARMSKLWADGTSIARIAEAVGRSEVGVTDFIARNRDWFPQRPFAQHGRINTDKLIRLLADGQTKQQACETFGVTRSAINMALRRRALSNPINTTENRSMEA